MNSHRLSRAATSFLLATSLAIAPWSVALAAPAEGPADEAPPADEPAGEEPAADEPATAEPAEEDPSATEPAEGEGTPAEGEAAEGEAAGDEAAETAGEESEAEEAAPPAEEAAPPEPEGPERPDEPRWGKEKQHEMKGSGMIAAGVATTVLGAGFIGLAFGVTKCDDGTQPGCKYAPNRTFLVPTAITATGTGLLILAVGLSLRKKYKDWETWSPEQAMISPALFEGGGGVNVGGRF